MQWYLNQNLAIKISDSPPSIQLTFNPKGHGHGEAFTFSEDDNRCTVCGSNKNLIRHSIVPHFYKKYLPDNMKSHYSHDIVLLCIPCHIKCDEYDMKLSLKIHEENNIKYENNRIIIQHDIYTAIKAAKAIIQSKNNIPLDRINLLKDKIKVLLNKDDINDDDINKVCKMNPKEINEDYTPSSKIVIEKIGNDEGINGYEKFVKRWRSHFIDIMKPKYLPKFWSIDSPVINPSAK